MKQLSEQLKKVIDLGTKADKKFNNSVGNTTLTLEFLTSARAVIYNIAGNKSTYSKSFEEIMCRNIIDNAKISSVLGVLKSLSDNFHSGFLESYSELIHGETFGNFLEMADHLFEEGYKDAAAVIAGSTLEEHLRQLCKKNSIDFEITNSKGNIVPKKADKLNSDLASANVYEKLDQKSIIAWLDLRNKAAHGKYSEFTKEQVQLMISGIRDFMTRNRA